MSSKSCHADRSPPPRLRPGWEGGWQRAGFAALLLAAGTVLAEEGGAPRVGERLAAATTAPAGGVHTLEWEDLLPKDWNPRAALEGVDLAALSDDDPRAGELLARLRAGAGQAPVVGALDGRRVRIAGFTVTLERDRDGVREFLLVPYFGACIHTPPPPANQIVHVLPAQAVPPETAIFPVWVTGTLRTVAAQTAEGTAGYRIADAQVEPYPWRRQRR
jgi:hypothetical protein